MVSFVFADFLDKLAFVHYHKKLRILFVPSMLVSFFVSNHSGHIKVS